MTRRGWEGRGEAGQGEARQDKLNELQLLLGTASPVCSPPMRMSRESARPGCGGLSLAVSGASPQTRSNHLAGRIWSTGLVFDMSGLLY